MGEEHSRTHITREVRAGFATFLTMSYILFVNPNILSNAIVLEGENLWPQLMSATALAAAFGCILMGILGKRPFALAPGMGLNAYFTYSVVLGQGVSWQAALGAVFLSGALFLLISLVGLREVLINAIPSPLKHAITAGIGCFLATIGMVNAGLVVDHPVTLVALGNLREPTALIALFGLILTVVLLVFDLKGAVLLGIAGSTLAAMVSGAEVYQGQAFAGFQDGVARMPVWPKDLFLALDLAGALKLGAVSIIFTFLFVDFFDTAGTLIGLSHRANLLDKEGKMTQARAAFSVDALATSIGALFGTSSTTSYIESAAGIEEGGRTGLTAITVGVLFLLSLFLWPLASAVPAAATAPALMVIGAMMLFTTTNIDWNDYKQSLPAMLTILGMPLTYSITNGISLGLISYCAIHLFSGRGREVHWVMYVLSALLVVRFALPG